MLGLRLNKKLGQLYKVRLQRKSEIKYLNGFRNTQMVQMSEEVLPRHTNPQQHPLGLVTEQMTGPQGFTGEASGQGPLRLWLYKQNRSVKISSYVKTSLQPFQVEYCSVGPNPLRVPADNTPLTCPTHFVEGLKAFGDNQHVLQYNYHLNQSMSTRHCIYHNCDGEILIQPSKGHLIIFTECGQLEVEPGIIAVIPKNMKFQVNLASQENEASGIITELKNDRSFRLPHRGPLGANGLANPEYFQSPTPCIDTPNLNKEHQVICKKQNELWQAVSQKSPLDVMGWKGNYSPYRFNLGDFVPVVAGQKDHLDPSSHLVLAVTGEDGANWVELVVFAPRHLCTSKANPTYLPPYDHRNNGKAELMHYLGGYEARQGSQSGDLTLHDMGVAHGNDQATFDKTRAASEAANTTVYIDTPPATMVEVTGCMNVTQQVLNRQDVHYRDQLAGESVPVTRPKHSHIGKSRQVTFTALHQTLVPLFDVLMPNPQVNTHPLTGHQTRKYTNASGDIFMVNTNTHLNQFWQVYKQEVEHISEHQVEHISDHQVGDISDDHLLQATQTIQSFFNRGTVVSNLSLEVDNPEETAKYYVGQGMHKGRDDQSVCIEQDSPFNFRFIEKREEQKNEEALVSTIDHTVINCYKDGLDSLFTLFPHTFWGGDPRDLRAPGVQFYTRVLTNDKTKIHQMVPVNNLDESEEELLKRIQKGDTFVPPYIQTAVMNNQISRGLFDTNRTKPTNSYNAFLQHIAMAVNQKYGDISEHLLRLKKHGLQLIPPPPEEYYRLSEIDLSQRLVLPSLLRMMRYDAFELPYEFFNGLLKPKDASLSRLQEILRDNQMEENAVQQLIHTFSIIQPVLHLIGNSVTHLDVQQIKLDLHSIMTKQGIPYQDQDIELLVALLKFNKQKIEKAASVGSLLDFQIIQEREQSGYIDQTFSVPVSIGTEGTSGLFFEFITRTCYDDVFELIEMDKLIYDSTSFKSCGAFGQGNFANLMLGQQKGIDSADRKRQQQAAKSGELFQLPMLDLQTIQQQPTQHLYQHIQKTTGQKAQLLSQIAQNITNIITESKKRGLWN